MKSWWQVLGVPRKSDRATIRRAYAKKLRVTNPEDDPQGFMALREAYEAALRWVEYDVDWEESDEEAVAQEPAFAVELAEPLQSPDPVPAFDPAPPEPDPLAEARAADHEELRRRTAALDAGLRGPWHGDAAALTAQLDAILAAPALIEIAVRDSIENWLADLLADTSPRSDPVLRHAIDAFGWEDEGNHPPSVWRILARIDEWRVIQALRRGDHALSAGWNALTRAKAPGWQRRVSSLRPGIAAQVRQLFDLADYQTPGIAHSFDPDAAAWWRAHLDAPRFGFVDLATLLLAAALAGVVALVAETPAARIGGAAAALLSGIAFPFVRLRIVVPWRERREMADEAPGWLADAWPVPWLVAALLLVVLPAGAWTAGIVSALCTVATGWMAVTVGREPAIGSPLYKIFSFAVLALIGGAAFFALSGPEKLALSVFAAASALIAFSGSAGLAAALWRVVRWPTLAALAITVTLILSAIIRFQLPGAPEPLVPWGATAIAGMVLLGAVREIADSSPVVPVLPWARWGLWIMLVFAAILSTPPVERSGVVPADPMKQLEQREPGFAALKMGNPGLHSAVALLRQQQADRTKTGAEASREIDRLVNAAYRERLPRAPAALLAAEMDIRLATLREYRGLDVRACASGAGEGKSPQISETLRERHYRHALKVAGSYPASASDLARGREIPANELLRVAANDDAAKAERLGAAMEGSDVKAKCDARIAFLEALVAQDDIDIAKTMRPALTARAEPDSAKK
ncbi:hypothetical protein OK349_10395 [Sphingomonas sp. BT-65]|uniref:hypothetical protein n=1 Tax=Sphingomonas sp. BT-65 TaxID=2989821 RepID=UPI0022355EBF|nr:hypothetical protein [Sphingomonas sp. BT-65]MCW4462116.1 hypothetical protein [Sphingomonas sp. BT-65]